jgi:aldehyde:ferredoxin oxidoreductase
MSGGYMDKAYDVNLTTGQIREFQPSREDQQLYLGGKGLGTRLLYDHTRPGLDPYDEQMILVFATGPVTGTGAPQSNRFVVSTKSPLTGAIGNSTCGGNFATKLKKAGVDLVLIRGKAAHPVYLEITEQGAAIKDAAHLWGKGAMQTQSLLPKDFGKAVIGPAGENLVRYACIVSEERVAGRTGCGAVMGSKNLKAVIANGKRKIEITEEARYKEFQKSMTKFLLGHPMTGGILPALGTANIVATAAGRNILPCCNYQKGTDLRAMAISGERLAAKHLKKRVGCMSCPVICGRGIELRIKDADGTEQLVSHPDGKHKGISKGPEYETLGLLGSNLGCFDLERIFEWNHLCDDLGMDTISLGGTLGFATELTERGMLASPLSFDHHEAVTDLIRDTAYRRGLGNDLAEGTRRLAQKYGGHDFAIHVKGLELPAYDPRGCYGQGLEYATTNRGGCHIQGATMYLEATGPLSVDPLSTKAKPELVVLQQNLSAALCSSVYCMFASYAMIPSLAFELDPQGMIYGALTKVLLHSGPVIGLVLKSKAPVPLLWFEKFVSYVIGRTVTMGEYTEIGERVFNLERMYNLREGLTAADDTLPPRLLDEPTFAGHERGVPLANMLPRYYRVRRWDAAGIPTPQTLDRLSIRT